LSRIISKLAGVAVATLLTSAAIGSISTPTSAARATTVREISHAAPSAGHAGEVVITALSPNRHAKWRYADSKSWHRLGAKLRFAHPPSVYERPGHSLTFVGADSAGHAYARGLYDHWHSVSSTRCFQPAAATSKSSGLVIACRNARGRLEIAEFSGRGHAPTVRPNQWTLFHTKLRGGPAILSEPGNRVVPVLLRTTPFTRSGNDAKVLDVAGFEGGGTYMNPTYIKVGLHCSGSPAVAGQQSQASGACPSGSRHIQWRYSTFETKLHRVHTAFSIAGRVGLVQTAPDDDVDLFATDPYGGLHVVDLLTGKTSPLGNAGPYGVDAVLLN
jgi:hypothetical protein